MTKDPAASVQPPASEQRSATPILEMIHISKSFGGTQALEDVSLQLYSG